MKTRTIAGLILLGALAVPAAAQDPTGNETYTFTTSSIEQALRVNLGRRIHNEKTCNSAALALDCTQAQVRAVTGHETDSIYANDLAGRTLFLLREILLPWFQTVLNQAETWEQIRAGLTWCAASQADKDATCTSAGIGLAAGCQLYACN